MDPTPISDNPYRAPQTSLQHSPAIAEPDAKALTWVNVTIMFGASTACGVILFVAHALLGGILAPQFFVAHYGTFSWERLRSYAARDGFAYGTIFSVCLLGAAWYFLHNQVVLNTLRKCYSRMVLILFVSWLCGGMLGLIVHANGWANWIPAALKFDNAKQLLAESPETAWLIGAQSTAIACGTISLVAIPIYFVHWHRKRMPRVDKVL